MISGYGDYAAFETGFTLDPQEKIRLVLNYDLASNLSIDADNNSYELYWQKQPGTSGDEYNFVFSPPFGSVVSSVSTDLLMEESSVKATGYMSEDLNYFLSLQ